MVTRRPAPNLRGTLTWLYVRGEFLMTVVNFFGGAEVGGEGPSYHCASVGLATNGLRPTPSAMRLKSRRFILCSCEAVSLDSNPAGYPHHLCACAVLTFDQGMRAPNSY